MTTRDVRLADMESALSQPRWYVALAQPRNEELALVNLRRQGFEAFYPQRWETRRYRRGFDTRLRPVFPRYLFVSIDCMHQRWRSVNGTYGVSTLLVVGDRPSPVPHGVVETLRLSVDADGALQFERGLSPGDHIRLIRGPFANQLGVLERLDENGRVRLLLDVLGGRVHLSVPREQIERI